MNKHTSSFNFILGLVFLVLVLALPSGITAWFDGLPWTGGAETLVLVSIIPFLFILGRRFLSFKLPMVFLGILLLIKTVLFLGSPAGGWRVQVQPNLTQEQSALFMPFELSEGDAWVRTYATLWNERASGILKKPWTEKLDFPLDWVLFGDMGRCGVSTGPCFDALTPIIKIEGALLLPKGKKFALVAEGVEGGAFSATNESGETIALSHAKNFAEAAQSGYQLPKDGTWKISGKLLYGGTAWSFIPVLIEADGKITSDLGRDVLWQNAESLTYIGLYKVLSWVVDIGVVLFLLVWLGWVASALARMEILNLPLAGFGLFAVCLPFIMAPFFAKVLKIVRLPDPTNVSYLGISVTAAGLGFLFWVWWKKDFRNFQTDRIVPSIFLLFGPATLFYFSHKWWPFMGQWTIWGTGDDWTSYQFLAHKIVVEGEWLSAGEGVFILQPLYRYFVGFYHWLFGQSAFAQHMADVWCVFGASIILTKWTLRLKLPTLAAFIVVIGYLMMNLIGAFRYHIGRGLMENHAMIFMFLAGWFLYQAREGGIHRVILATLCGILGFWTRLDHLGAIVGLVFLAFEPVDGPTGGWRGYWDRVKAHWQRLAWYWGGGLVLGVGGISFRNWWLGGIFSPINHQHPNLTMDLQRGDFYQILTGVEWPAFPTISGLVVTIGTVMGLLALVWHRKPLLNFPLSLGITMLGLLAPFAFLTVTGYPPRFSIHLIPLALLSLAIVLNNLLTGVKFPKVPAQKTIV